MTVLVPVLVNTPVVARIGIDKIGLSAEAISQGVPAGALGALARRFPVMTIVVRRIR